MYYILHQFELLKVYLDSTCPIYCQKNTNIKRVCFDNFVAVSLTDSCNAGMHYHDVSTFKKKGQIPVIETNSRAPNELFILTKIIYQHEKNELLQGCGRILDNIYVPGVGIIIVCSESHIRQRFCNR